MGPRGADFWRRQEEWGQGKVLQAEHTPCRGIEVQEGSVHITPSLLLGPYEVLPGLRSVTKMP